MKLKVLQESLSDALSIATRFSSSRVQLPVLANIYLESSKNKIIIASTNLETSILLRIGAKVEKEGKITVPSKVIADLVSNLTPGQIGLESEKENLKISSSSFSSVISGVNASDFPKVPDKLVGEKITLSSSKLKKALSQVLFCTSTDETRPVLTGVLFIIRKGELVLVSTDGFRLSQVRVENKNIKLEEEVKIILPKNSISEILRLIEKDDIVFSFDTKENQVVFLINDKILATRIIEGEFPDFERIIPKETLLNVDIDKSELVRAIKLASVFSRDAGNVVKFEMDKNKVNVIAQSSQSGSQKTTLDAKIVFDDSFKEKKLVIAYNYKFIDDFLNSVEGESVEMSFSDQNSPGIFKDPKETKYLHIIMPVRIQS